MCTFVAAERLCRKDILLVESEIQRRGILSALKSLKDNLSSVNIGQCKFYQGSKFGMHGHLACMTAV